MQYRSKFHDRICKNQMCFTIVHVQFEYIFSAELFYTSGCDQDQNSVACYVTGRKLSFQGKLWKARCQFLSRSVTGVMSAASTTDQATALNPTPHLQVVLMHKGSALVACKKEDLLTEKWVHSLCDLVYVVPRGVAEKMLFFWEFNRTTDSCHSSPFSDSCSFLSCAIIKVDFFGISSERVFTQYTNTKQVK